MLSDNLLAIQNEYNVAKERLDNIDKQEDSQTVASMTSTGTSRSVGTSKYKRKYELEKEKVEELGQQRESNLETIENQKIAYELLKTNA